MEMLKRTGTIKDFWINKIKNKCCVEYADIEQGRTMDLNLVWAWFIVFFDMLETSSVAHSGCLSWISNATKTKKNRGKIKNYCSPFLW
jgi:hypothetical protein